MCFAITVGPISSSGTVLVFTVYIQLIDGSSPQQGPLVSQLEMITVIKCDFIVLSILHTKEVTNGTREGRMANVESAVPSCMLPMDLRWCRWSKA